MEVFYIVLLNFVVFFRTIRYGLVIDDVNRASYEDEHYKYSTWQKFRASLHGSTVPVHLRLDHFTTLALHTAASMLVYYAFGIVPALLFSIHPVNNQVSVWLNGKRYAIGAILTLLIWLLRPWGVALYLFMPIWHYNGMIAPLLYLFTPYWWIPAASPVLFAVKPSIITTLVRRAMNRKAEIADCDVTKVRWGKLPIYFKSLAYYFQHCLFPRKMSFFHSFLDDHGFTKEKDAYWCKISPMFWFGVTVFVSIILISAFNIHNPVGFGLMWWLLFISQWCNFPITLTQHISDRTCYIANAGLMYAVYGTIQLIPNTYAQVAVTSALFAYYLATLLKYIWRYDDVESFVLNCLDVFPDNSRTNRYIVKSFMVDSKWMHALAHCSKSLKYDPKDFTLNLYMAKIFYVLNHKQLVIKYLDEAAKNPVCGEESKCIEQVTLLRKELDSPVPVMEIKY